MSLRNLMVMAAVILGSGCGEEWGETTGCGPEVRWGDQGDRESFCSVISACEQGLGKQLMQLDGVRVEFRADIQSACFPNTTPNLAGCWQVDWGDIIYLTYSDVIENGALCHELLHRQIFIESGGSWTDKDHTLTDWGKIP